MIKTQREEIYLPMLESGQLPDLGKEYWVKKRQRQQVDGMLQTMENRVRMLKSEEEKLWKKIGNNQNEANIVLNVKEQNRQINLTKLQNRQGLAMRQQFLQALHSEKRVLQHHLKQDISVASFNEHHNQYYSIKLDTIKNEKYIIAFKNDLNINKQILGSSIKGDKVQAIIKNQSRMNKKSESFRDEYRRKITGEEVLHDSRQNRIYDLEAIETKLMDRLKNTQTLNQDIEGRLRDLRDTKSYDILDKVSDMNLMNQQIKRTKFLFKDGPKSIGDITIKRGNDSTYQTANNEVSMIIQKRRKIKIKKVQN